MVNATLVWLHANPVPFTAQIRVSNSFYYLTRHTVVAILVGHDFNFNEVMGNKNVKLTI